MKTVGSSSQNISHVLESPGRVILETEHLQTHFFGHYVFKDVSLKVYEGEVVVIIGGSGCGKSTLLRNIMMLVPPHGGVIKVFDQDVLRVSHMELMNVRKRIGMMFQKGALFSSLSVLENVAFPLRLNTVLSQEDSLDLAMLKLNLVGFPLQSANKSPQELSGGMIKRVAVARAMVMDPELLCLDEPTAGLDPQAAAEIDELILHLQKELNITIMVVTHDLDTLWEISDRVIFLGEGRVLAAQSLEELINNPHPLIQKYFSGSRANVVKRQETFSHKKKSLSE